MQGDELEVFSSAEPLHVLKTWLWYQGLINGGLWPLKLQPSCCGSPARQEEPDIFHSKAAVSCTLVQVITVRFAEM